MAVLDEVQVADPEDVDRRHRLAALARRGDPLPAPARSAWRGGTSGRSSPRRRSTVPDDRVERDLLLAEVASRCARPSAATTSSNGSIGETSSARSAGGRPAARARAGAARLTKSPSAAVSGVPAVDCPALRGRFASSLARGQGGPGGGRSAIRLMWGHQGRPQGAPGTTFVALYRSIDTILPCPPRTPRPDPRRRASRPRSCGPTADDRFVERWVRERGLELTPGDRAIVARYLRRARGADLGRRGRARSLPTVVALVVARARAVLGFGTDGDSAPLGLRRDLRRLPRRRAVRRARLVRPGAAARAAASCRASSPHYLPRRALLAQRALADLRRAGPAHARACRFRRARPGRCLSRRRPCSRSPRARGVERWLVRRPQPFTSRRSWRPTTRSAPSRCARWPAPGCAAAAPRRGVSLGLRRPTSTPADGHGRRRPCFVLARCSRAGTSARAAGACGARAARA